MDVGNNNIAVGYQAGYNINDGNNNIDVGSDGRYGDNGVIRIGTTGTNTETFIAGVINGDNGNFLTGGNSQSTVNGSFVWSDGTGAAATATNDNSVVMRANGGYWLYSSTNNDGVRLLHGDTSWNTLSDRNAKKNFAPVDAEAVLEKLATIPVEKWNYKWQSDQATPNIGPMAQDFKHAFYPGRDDKGITTLEFDGVELAAIQGLNKKLGERTTVLEQELKRRDAEVATLQMEVADLHEEFDGLQKAVAILAVRSAGTFSASTGPQNSKCK